MTEKDDKAFTVHFDDSEEKTPKEQGETILFNDTLDDVKPESITNQGSKHEDSGPIFSLPPVVIKGFQALFYCFAIVLLINVGLDTYSVYISASEIHWVLAAAFAAFITILLVLFVFVISQYLFNSRDHNRFIDIQEKAEKLKGEKTSSVVKEFLSMLTSTYKGRPQEKLLTECLNELPDYSNGQEAITFIERNFYEKLDNQALSVVIKASQGNFATIALSPWAAVDMLFMFTRNIVLMEQIAQIYGIQPSLPLRIRLIKRLFTHVILVGAIDMLQEALVEIGMEAGPAYLSASVGQGLSAGFLTTRIGVVSIDYLRPISFYSSKRPSVLSVTKNLIKNLTVGPYKKLFAKDSSE